MVRSYLNDRRIVLLDDQNYEEICVTSGVPQGSVLGPTLWNVFYDSILREKQPEGVTTIGFADDVALVVVAKTYEELEVKANAALANISNAITRKGLQLAPEKTEAVFLTGRRKTPPITLVVEGVIICPKKCVRYLGVMIDSHLNFVKHVKGAAEKACKLVTALSKLLPNVGGPSSSKRKILGTVTTSVMLYAAPIWSHKMNVARTRGYLQRVQRVMALRTASLYRTVSREAALVVAGILPVELLAEERTKIYTGGRTVEIRTAARDALFRTWQETWDASEKGRWTHRIIPNIKKWVERKSGEVNYFISQILSGHGSFGNYLCRIGRTDESTCIYCREEEDNVEHTLFKCIRWQVERDKVTIAVGQQLTPQTLVSAMLESNENWDVLAKMMYNIIRAKEDDERELERIGNIG